MRNISHWAYRHKGPARLLIIGIQLLWIPLAFFLADLLQDLAIPIAPLWTWLLMLAVLLAIAVHPEENHRRGSYRFRKGLDVLIAGCSFALLCLAAGEAITPATATTAHSTYTTTQAASYSLPVKPSLKKKKAVVRTWIRTFRARYRHSDNAGKIVLIILTLLVATALVLILAALSCSIACESSGALAIIVFVLGVAGIVLLARAIIRRLRFGPRAKPELTPPSTT